MQGEIFDPFEVKSYQQRVDDIPLGMACCILII